MIELYSQPPYPGAQKTHDKEEDGADKSGNEPAEYRPGPDLQAHGSDHPLPIATLALVEMPPEAVRDALGLTRRETIAV
jgi:hypothetical protein